MLEWLASDYRPLVQDVVALSTCLAAFVWGAGPERATATVWLVCFELAGLVYRTILGGDYQLQSTDFYLASTDLCAGVLWILIALNANRNYPLIIAALQLLVMSAHLARGFLEAISPVAYATMVIAPGWLQLFILALGVSRHFKRHRRYGPYRAWRKPIDFPGLFSTHQK
jgi:hypothetical protein